MAYVDEKHYSFHITTQYIYNVDFYLFSILVKYLNEMQILCDLEQPSYILLLCMLSIIKEIFTI